MKLFTHEDGQVSNKKAKDRLSVLSNIKWVSGKQDYSDASWEEYTSDGDKGVSKSWVKDRISKLNEYHLRTIDMYFALIRASNWEEDDIWGWHWGRSFEDARVCLVKNRHGYADTFVHEFLHAVNVYIYVHTGTKLKHVFDVPDFDDYVVHAEGDAYTEYEYDQVLEKIKPYFQEAVGEDMADEYRTLAQKALPLLSKRVRQLRANLLVDDYQCDHRQNL